MGPQGMAVSTVYRRSWSLELARLGAGPTVYHLPARPRGVPVLRGREDGGLMQPTMLEAVRGASSFTWDRILVVLLGTCAACQSCEAQARQDPADGKEAERNAAGTTSTARQQCSAPGIKPAQSYNDRAGALSTSTYSSERRQP